MAIDFVSNDEKKGRVRKPEAAEHPHDPHPSGALENPVSHLQRQIGNRAVQRLLVQRSGNSPYQLDEDTTGRINSARSGGQPLDGSVQKQMGEAFNSDFSSVQVHTDSEANSLNHNLSAKAFTTGNDIFFRQGEYNPQSSSGQELIAHELTHVVQQSTGQVENGGGMTVNAPNDKYEQEADQAASTLTSSQAAAGLQRQEYPEEEELQTQASPEEEELQTQEIPEEEEIQTNGVPEEEEELAQTKRDR